MSAGFIGLGLIGSRRFKIARDLGYPIAFAVDPDVARHQALKQESCVFARSLEELDAAGASKADIIFVAVPHDLALRACQWALAKKAHALCEKPLGISLAQATEIRALAEAARVKLCAGFNYRYLPAVRTLRQMLREGKFGELYRARFHIGHGGRPGMETEWKLKKARAGGGAVIDPGIHLVDLARHLFGEVTVEASQLRRRFWQTDVEDNCVLALRCGGADLQIDVSLTSWKNAFSIEVYGRDGMAVLTGRGGNYGTQSIEYLNRWFWQGADHRLTKDFGVPDESFEHETRAFLQLCESGNDDGTLSSADDGCAALRIVEDLYARADEHSAT